MTKIVRAPKERPIKNGIQHPGIRGVCAEAWMLFSMLHSADILTAQMIRDKGDELGLNPGNIGVELPRWRRYHSIV